MDHNGEKNNEINQGSQTTLDGNNTGLSTTRFLASIPLVGKLVIAVTDSNYIYLISAMVAIGLVCFGVFMLFDRGYDEATEVFVGDTTFSSESSKSLMVPAGMIAPAKPTVSSVPPQVYEGRELVDLTILGACNAAYGGAYNSPSVLLYHIDRGLRAFDFEVYDETGNGILTVGYGGNQRSNTVNRTGVSSSSSDSEDSITLNSLIGTLRNAFNAVHSPTHTDPVFLHLRLQVVESNAELVSNFIYSYMEENFGDKWGGKQIKSGHVMLYIDGTTAPWLNSIASNPSVKKLYGRISGVTGTSPLIYRGQSEVNTAISGAPENANSIVPGVVLADMNTSKLSLFSFSRKDKPINLLTVSKSSVAPKFNIIFQPFYTRNSDIATTEKIFDSNIIMSLEEFYYRVKRQNDQT